MNSISVLLVAPLPPPPGGIASWTRNVLHYYETNYSNNELILKICNSAIKGRRITSSSIVTRVIIGIMNACKMYIKIRKSLNSEIQVLHLVSSASYSLLKDYLILKLANRRGIPTVIHWRFGRIPDLYHKNNWEFKLLRKVAKIADFNIVLDQNSEEVLSKYPRISVIKIPNPISADLKNLALENKSKFPEKTENRLVFVGHVIKGKGVYELVEVCSGIEDIEKLTVIGPYENSVKKTLEEIAHKSKRNHWLQFTGTEESPFILRTLKETPILILPSHTEGFPNVILEGMAMGCAIIATDVGAIPEMLNIGKDNACGLCVSPRNSEELATAINQLINNRDKSSEMGVNGIRRVLDEYTMEDIFNKYISIWRLAVKKAQN